MGYHGNYIGADQVSIKRFLARDFFGLNLTRPEREIKQELGKVFLRVDKVIFAYTQRDQFNRTLVVYTGYDGKLYSVTVNTPLLLGSWAPIATTKKHLREQVRNGLGKIDAWGYGFAPSLLNALNSTRLTGAYLRRSPVNTATAI